jgi:hypothetical protein
MPNGKQNHRLPLNPVKHKISALAKGNKPFAKFRVHIFGGMADARLRRHISGDATFPGSQY